VSTTIDDIARAAGVSTATVSRVINKNYPVSQKARRSVEQAIQQLRYTPNVFARGLMKAHTDSVGIIVPFISNPYHMQIVDAIEEELSRKQVFIYLCCSYDDPEREAAYVASLSARHVDALIIVEAHSMNSRRNHFLELDLPQPIILVNEHVASRTKHHIVRCAQEPGVQEAFEHFRSSGLRRIALLRGAGYSFDLKQRLFKRFCRDNGFVTEVNPVVRIRRANEPESVHEAAAHITRLLSGPHPPQAILAGNELIAIGVLQGALAAGARVGKDLRIIGVDNTVISQISSPRLSTVDLRMNEVGRAAARAYLELREGGFRREEPIRHTLQSRLLHRETS